MVAEGECMSTELRSGQPGPGGQDGCGHPAPDELLKYHEGTLSTAATDRVQEHLVQCAECAQVVLDLAAFPRIEPRDEARRVSPLELAEQWRRLERAIERRSRPLWKRHEVLLPLAASLACAVILLVVWSSGLRRQLHRLAGPRGDVAVSFELPPDGATRGAGELLEIPSWAERVVVSLVVPPGRPFDRYGVDTFGADGERILTGVPVHRTEEGLAAVDLPRGSLGSGPVRIDLFGIDDAHRVRLASYSFTVVDEGS